MQIPGHIRVEGHPATPDTVVLVNIVRNESNALVGDVYWGGFTHAGIDVPPTCREGMPDTEALAFASEIKKRFSLQGVVCRIDHERHHAPGQFLMYGEGGVSFKYPAAPALPLKPAMGWLQRLLGGLTRT